MIYLPGLVLALGAFWFALSGQTAWLFLLLGVISVLLSVWLAGRLGIIGRDASPYHRTVQMLVYTFWLVGEIIKANITVIRSVLDPRHTISPALVKVPAGCRSDLAKALFANSITLTPGTVTVDVAKGTFLVHALQEEHSRVHTFAPMDRNASLAADGRPRAKPEGPDA
jgi:multicomponent Na+:H+ antiporter subunit E